MSNSLRAMVKMSREARTTLSRQDNFGSQTILDAPPSAKLRATCRFTGHTGLGAKIAFVEGLPQVLIEGKRQRRGSFVRVESLQ